MPLLAQPGVYGIGTAAENYQGMIFFRPFFFLLVDSFCGSAVLSAGFAFGSVAGVVPLPVAPVVSVPAVAA